MNNGFEKQNAVGKKAEAAVIKMLEARGNTVKDVSADVDYQAIDTDLLVTDLNGNQIFLEVKGDSKAKVTGNVFLEVGKYRKTGYYPQWLSKSKCQVIAFYDSDTKEADFYNFEKLKALAEGRKIKTYWDNTDKCYATAILIPKAEAKVAFIKQLKGE